MSLNDILNEDKEWRKEFAGMKVTGTCDACREAPAKHWFGNTNQAYCGSLKCLDKLQDAYNEYVPKARYDVDY